MNNLSRVPLSPVVGGLILIEPDRKTKVENTGKFPIESDVGRALSRQPEPIGFVLRGVTRQIALDISEQIRQSKHWMRPVWIWDDAEIHSVLPPLFEGTTTDLSACALQASRMQNLLESLRLDVSALQADEKLLVYLYIRENSTLLPFMDRQSLSLWRYPVADALSFSPQSADAMLQQLVQRRLLTPRQLIDRTRHCPACGSAHPHFIDVCPHCASIDIRKAPALHCFTCGHVAPQTDFQATDGLVCPQCRTSLRHIGVDYDRPLTQYVCWDCHHAFIEPEIIARCLDCGAKNTPDGLQSRDISSLVLSPQGRTALRTGRLDESFAAMDIPNFVIPNYFRYIVDWALAAHKRHADLGFGLVLMVIHNAEIIASTIGHQRAYELFDELVRRIGELLRDSDIVTRQEEHKLWFFLPLSSVDGFTQRLKKELRELTAADMPELIGSFSTMETPKGVQEGDTATRIMQRLEFDIEGHA